MYYSVSVELSQSTGKDIQNLIIQTEDASPKGIYKSVAKILPNRHFTILSYENLTDCNGCSGCRDNQPNQEAHLGPGGCLED